MSETTSNPDAVDALASGTFPPLERLSGDAGFGSGQGLTVEIEEITVCEGGALFFGSAGDPTAAVDPGEDPELLGRRRRLINFREIIARRVATQTAADVIASSGGFDVDRIIEAVIKILEERWKDRPLLLEIMLLFVRSVSFRADVENL